jgi:hypothetical protein
MFQVTPRFGNGNSKNFSHVFHEFAGREGSRLVLGLEVLIELPGVSIATQLGGSPPEEE